MEEDIIKYHAWVGTKLINSVENLLKRYKELEEENKKIKNSNDTLKSFVPSILKDTFEKDLFLH